MNDTRTAPIVMEGSSSASCSWPAANAAGWAFLICAVVGLSGIFDRDLTASDETRVGAIALEMSRTGGCIVPHLGGVPFVEHPPLYYAVAAASARLFGPLFGPTGAIRLTSALWGLASLAVVFLMARRLLGARAAPLAVVMLATMWGFAENSHWIRVDIALLFFVSAALWSLSEAYVGGRPRLLPLAGLFAAGALLVKGPIGPLLIGIGGMGLFVPWLARGVRTRSGRWFVSQHLVALAAFCIVAGVWAMAFWKVGGPDLWRAWFWDNQIGRFTGTAAVLGHVKTGRPFFYLGAMAGDTMPWLPLAALWLARFAGDLKARRPIAVSQVFLLAWAAGGMVILSLSSSKRSLYLLPMLPAFALMFADAVCRGVPGWLRRLFVCGTALCAMALGVMAAAPLIVPLLPAELPGAMESFLRVFSWRHAVAAAGLALCIHVMASKRWRLSPAAQMAVCAAIFYVGYFHVVARAMDVESSVKAGYSAFCSSVPPDDRPRVMGWKLMEADRGAFYFYANWAIPVTDDMERIERIAAGLDREFDKIVFFSRDSKPRLPAARVRVVAKQPIVRRGHEGALYMIEKAAAAGPGLPGSGPEGMQ